MILPHKVHRILSDLINSPHKVRTHSGCSVSTDLKEMGACNQRKENHNLNGWRVTRRHSLINIKQMILEQVKRFQFAELLIVVADLN